MIRPTPRSALRSRPRLVVLLIALIPAVLIGPSGSAAAPDDPALRGYHAANGFLSRGLNELAVREYRAFLDQHADHDRASTARYGLGVALHRLGRVEESADALAPLVGVDFEFAADADLLLGQCRFTQGRYADAAARFTSMLSRDPEHASAPVAAALLVEAEYRGGDDRATEAAAVQFLERFVDDAGADRVLFFRALAAMRSERYTDAATHLKTLLDTTPDSALADRAILLRAQCLQRTGATDEAARLFSRVANGKVRALLPDALYGLATALDATGQAAAAKTAYDHFLEASPDDDRAADAGVRLARLLIDAGRLDRARAVLREAAARPNADQGAVLYWLAKCDLRDDHPADAATLLARAAEAAPDHALAAETLYDLALARARAGDHKGADAVLQRFHDRFDNHALSASALALHAATRSRMGDHAGAARLCREYLTGHDDSDAAASIRFLLAESLLLAGDDDAAPAYADYLDRHPDGADADRARLRLGTIFYSRGDYASARPLLESLAPLVERDGAFVPALLMLGEIAFAESAWDDAERLMSGYLRVAPADAEARDAALLKIGLARVRRGDHAGAVEALTDLLDGFADSPLADHARFERGQSLVALGRTSEAEGDFESVLDADADARFRAPAHNQLGALAAARGDHARAVEHFRAAARIATDDAVSADALARLGRSLGALGHNDESARVYARLVRDFPEAGVSRQADARRALALARADRNDEALRLIDRITDADYARLPAALASALRYEHAWILRDRGDTAGALAAYRALLAAEAEDSLRAHALVEIADLLIDEEKFADAGASLRRALDLMDDGADPAFRAGAEYRLGLSLHRVDAHTEAATHLVIALDSGALDPVLAAPAHLMAGESLYQTARYTDAADHFTAVIDAGGDDAGVATSLLRLGACRAQQRHWADSERAFTDYLSRFGDSPLWFQARFGEGWARENQSRYDDAMSAYREVVERHDGPTAARAQFQIGECLFALGRHADAAAELLKVDVLYASPEWSAAALYEAGRCFEALGQSAQARDQYRRVTGEHADTSWAPMARARLDALSHSELPGR